LVIDIAATNQAAIPGGITTAISNVLTIFQGLVMPLLCLRIDYLKKAALR
jgi:hypothetical protein